jgi:hypothetical protein
MTTKARVVFIYQRVKCWFDKQEVLVDDAEAQAAWIVGLEDDIALLREHRISPNVLITRLQEVLRGTRLNDWPRFRTHGGGISYQGIEGTNHWVCLEFRNVPQGRTFYEALQTLKPSFKAITTVSFREHKERATVSLFIPCLAPPPQ